MQNRFRSLFVLGLMTALVFLAGPRVHSARAARALAIDPLTSPALDPTGLESTSLNAAPVHPGALRPAVLAAHPDTASPRAEVPMTVSVFADTVQWSGDPLVDLEATLEGPAGLKSVGDVTYFDDGRLIVTFLPETDEPMVILPGDTITLTPDSGDAVTVTVPQFQADLERAGPRAVGIAPAGAEVSLTIRRQGAAPVNRKVTADAGGKFSADLAGGISVDTGTTGTATYVNPEGHRFVTQMAPFDATLTVGSDEAVGRGSLGTQVQITVETTGRLPATSAPHTIYQALPWTMKLPDGARLQQDTKVTVTQLGRPSGTPLTSSLTVPALQLALDAPANTVRGQSALSGEHRLEIFTATGAVTRTVTPSGGIAELALDAQGVLLSPGARATFGTMIGALRVQTEAILKGVRVGVYQESVEGALEPDKQLTATLKDMNGKVRFQTKSQTDSDGLFAFRMDDLSGPLAIPMLTQPGDTLEIDTGGATPTIVRIPPLSTKTDLEADTISGTTLPGAIVRIRGAGGGGMGGGAAIRTVVADANGHYEAKFTGQDLRQGSFGSVTINTADGNQFHTGWAGIRYSLYMDSPIVGATGVPGRAFTLTVRTPNGRVVGTGHGIVGGYGGDRGAFFGKVMDVTGAPVYAEGGDFLTAEVGEDVMTIQVPVLSAYGDVTADRVLGQASPGATVTFGINPAMPGQRPYQASVRAGPDGHFVYDLKAAGFDLKLGDTMDLSGPNIGHLIGQTGVVPAVRLDLDRGRVTGRGMPRSTVRAELMRGETVLGQGGGTTGLYGEFSVDLLDTGGRSVRPQPTDLLKVTPAGAEAFLLTVPRVTLEIDKDLAEASGLAPAGGWLQLTAKAVLIEMQPDPDTGSADVIVGPGGSFSEALEPFGSLPPGTVVTGIYRETSSGLVVVRRDAVPGVRIAHGGSLVCGYARPGTPVTATLSSTAGAVGSASERVGDWLDADLHELDGARPIAERDVSPAAFRLVVVDKAGQPVPLLGGQELSVKVGGEDLSLALPAMSAGMDWSKGQLTGQVPSREQWFLSSPADNCFGVALNDELEPTTFTKWTFSGATGAAAATLGAVPAGLGFQMGLADAEKGIVVYRQLVRPWVRAFIDSADVVGRAAPMDEVTLTQKSAAGAILGQAKVIAGPDGVFHATVLTASNQPALFQSGQLTVEASGDTVTLPAQKTALTFSTVGGIRGMGAPNSPIVLRPHLADGRVFRIHRSTDSAGSFRLSTTEVPPRGGWTLLDLVQADAAHVTAAGHEVVTTLMPGSLADWRYGVLLPRVVKGE